MRAVLEITVTPEPPPSLPGWGRDRQGVSAPRWRDPEEVEAGAEPGPWLQGERGREQRRSRRLPQAWGPEPACSSKPPLSSRSGGKAVATLQTGPSGVVRRDMGWDPTPCGSLWAHSLPCSGLAGSPRGRGDPAPFHSSGSTDGPAGGWPARQCGQSPVPAGCLEQHPWPPTPCQALRNQPQMAPPRAGGRPRQVVFPVSGAWCLAGPSVCGEWLVYEAWREPSSREGCVQPRGGGTRTSLRPTRQARHQGDAPKSLLPHPRNKTYFRGPGSREMRTLCLSPPSRSGCAPWAAGVGLGSWLHPGPGPRSRLPGEAASSPPCPWVA